MRVLAVLLTALAVATLGLVAATPAGAARAIPTGPEGDAFYTPPDPLPKAKPGTLIRAQPIPASAGAQAWRVLYHSQSVDGRDIAVSGTIVTPSGAAPKGGRPIVAWAHGTTGDADVCAPSKAADPLARVPFVSELLAQGVVVASTDYEGLGTPGIHPYLVGESEGRGVLDAARAARQLPETHASKKLLVYGHSQGGGAALFAGELARPYAPELDVLGVEAGAPVASAETIVSAALRIPAAAGFGILAVAGFDGAYPKANLEDVLTPEGQTQAAIVNTGCARDVIMSFATATTPVVAHNPDELAAWKKVLRANNAGNRPAGAPLLVVQGDADQLVVKPLTDAFVKQACAEGDTLDYRVYPGADHGGSLFAAKADILEFLAARLRGDKPQSTC